MNQWANRFFSVTRMIVVGMLGIGMGGYLHAMGLFPAEDADVANADIAQLTCQVTSVHDGDSLRVRCPGSKKTIPIRLHQIDAPELDQAYGIQSRDFLRNMCPVGKSVLVHDIGPDSYDRRLGRVFCNGEDANAAMVKSGSAWVYKHHASEQRLFDLQKEAQAARKGLWSARTKPVAPWTFRYQQRASPHRN